MRELDFFKFNDPIHPEKLLKKVVHISWEIDYEYLFNAIKNLNYDELKVAKDEILTIALNQNAVTNTPEAMQKYWERLLSHLSSNYDYQKPVSQSPDAKRMRKKR